MKQHSLLLMSKEKLVWQETLLPPLKDDEVLIKTIAGAISIGAELPQFQEKDMSVIHPIYPKGTGYESYGEVVQVGCNVTSVAAGDKVLAFYGHQDFGVVKVQKVTIVPDDLHPSYALLSILSCDAAKGVLKLKPKQGDKVLIIGMGVIGLLTVYFLKYHLGVEYIDAIEPNPHRRELAKKFGVNEVFSSAKQVTRNYTYGFECSATNAGFQSLQQLLLQSGEICILSDGNKEGFTLHPTFYEKELRIVASSDGIDYRKHAEWFFTKVRETPFVNEIFQYEVTKDNLIQCFHDLSDDKIQPVKVLVHY
ncbi:zinc-binding dehydrogenase [Bacillus manliponensis]|uniref:zinc-binding dehydrogenase n=1 Tax=Bacillus manliponensis TaxID=574376 RepID=UPI0035128A4D